MGSDGSYACYFGCYFFVIVFLEGVIFCRACNIRLGSGQNVQRHRGTVLHQNTFPNMSHELDILVRSLNEVEPENWEVMEGMCLTATVVSS